MDAYQYSELLKELQGKCHNIAQIIKPQGLQERLTTLIQEQTHPEFWQDKAKATQNNKEKMRVERLLQAYNKTKQALEEALELFELTQEDTNALEQLFEEAPKLASCIQNMEVEVMLSDPHDGLDALVSIQPGAGGTESQDWAGMLYRMYLRWAERRGFKVELLDHQEGEEAGIKGVAFSIKGVNVYGYMKNENGVHRLVRMSPFNANGKRHTSFASVQVSPEIDNEIDIVIEEKDIKIDTYRASGAGGQHVNKTDSAVRITHHATGIVVQCQNDRSQHKNKAMALKMLKSKLYELELHKQQEQNHQEEKSEIGWGHQIRSYVLAPYQQIKDARSEIAYSQVEAILDGDLDQVMQDVLVHKAQAL
ncbi:peptide chain release factor 2 [Helicobacter ailurogastricus]|uniref:Peptide chain release factor 2 n=1 Tax=Helicobacter ailurogastricus TaxID=1578720 RepID=A0A0K2Y5D2_9HELI|nr:peptide chain release factor 2 [Helicobacter ailurogastricus]BDQ28680.1 peptide chain release factor 2 [Helicobacter ailurogastricus]CRI32206.1 Peptide chain release factor 2 [Helicobacter ailurogastricus]